MCMIYMFSSVQSSLSLMSDPLRPMNRSTPGLHVHHQLPKFTQTHVHRVGDAIQPSSSPFPPAPNPSQHQGLFQWVNSSHEVAKVLKFQLQHQSFQWTPGTSEVMEFQLSYFKSWKMMLWKCCTQYASKLGKLGSGHRTRKGQFSFQNTYLAVHNFLKRD